MVNKIDKDLQRLTLLGVSQDLLLKLFYYNEEVGTLTWLVKINPRQNIGDIAGRVNRQRGRRDISVGGIRYKSTHLIWLYKTGNLPQNLIDHKNRDSLDDSWNNLREATYTQNNCNTTLRADSSSGVKGLSYCNTHQKWRGTIEVDNKTYSKRDKEKAVILTWLLETREKLHKEFTCYG